MKRIGVISDTHGKVRKEVIELLQDCDAILHAGDINTSAVAEGLKAIAPLYMVRGNADKEWAEAVPISLDEEICGLSIFMVHNKKDIPKDLGHRDLVVYGHSHKYEEREENGQRYLNPGSCGPRRFTQPITMAILEVEGKDIHIIKKDIVDAKAKEAKGLSESVNDGADILERQDRAVLIRTIMKEIDRGWPAEKIARKHGIQEETAVQICRMYLTHPGVDVDGILNRMS